MSFTILANTKSALERVDDFYLRYLDSFEFHIKQFANTKDLEESRERLQSARIVYKKIEWLVEYYNIYQARKINGADLLKADESNPRDTIFPEGLQVIETILYSSPTSARDLQIESGKLQETIRSLKNEEDRNLKYSDATLFDALRLSVIRVITLGITGFDSPLAKRSIEDAAASLESVKDILVIYREYATDSENYSIAIARAVGSIAFLKQDGDFNRFDRLKFITGYATPLLQSLTTIASYNNFILPPGRRALAPEIKNIFDEEAFNIEFFSPNSNYQLTPNRIELGKRLFSDPILSGNKSRSCASCHNPSMAFTDGLKVPKGMDNQSNLKRNTSTLLNSVFQTRQFYDMRTSKLENQISDVVHSENEMNGSLRQIIPALERDSMYRFLFAQAYGEITEYNIANAVASYVRTLVSMNSKFDRYMRGEVSKLNRSERNGFNLFMGKAKCGTCHFMPFFNGLLPTMYNETESEVLGVPAGPNRKKAVLDSDPGRSGFTQIPLHEFAFKTPTLKNISQTAPYMHNGVYQTLEEVLEFYNEGGGAGLGISLSNQTLPTEKLGLTKKEMQQIIDFLKALSD